MRWRERASACCCCTAALCSALLHRCCVPRAARRRLLAAMPAPAKERTLPAARKQCCAGCAPKQRCATRCASAAACARTPWPPQPPSACSHCHIPVHRTTYIKVVGNAPSEHRRCTGQVHGDLGPPLRFLGLSVGGKEPKHRTPHWIGRQEGAVLNPGEFRCQCTPRGPPARQLQPQ